MKQRSEMYRVFAGLYKIFCLSVRVVLILIGTGGSRLSNCAW
jgi:hypothetical protein